LPVTAEDQRWFTRSELADGWRLACRAQVVEPVTVELAQWEAAILGDDRPFAWSPRTGLGIVVDVGTTTVVAQLLDLATAEVRGVRSALNAQASRGADVLTRLEFALERGGLAWLTRTLREQVGTLMQDLLDAHGRGEPLADVVLVGNTVMHHFFSGQNIDTLAVYPFEPRDGGSITVPANLLHARLPEACGCRFLPCLGGMVGSDLLAGVLATGMDQSEDLMALVDLGTNGELVVGNRHRMLCASTAAGPAFEGARIAQGMRAVTGAIASVEAADGGWRCRVLGEGRAVGLCGSGLVDAVAVGLDLGRILASGRLASGTSLELMDGVALQASDLRELQLAKAAIAAGLRRLLERWGASPEDLTRVHLAGAFGNYVSRRSACRIGLLPVRPEEVISAGNTALRGAKLALFGAGDADQDPGFTSLRQRIESVSLGGDPRFEDIFVEEMRFPG
jgi:uncharacterized 2Fe-2S/4Fe-4S cluster protein (DUF4445 family)